MTRSTSKPSDTQQGSDVSGEDLQKFITATLQHNSSRGVFITTSAFTPAALKVAQEMKHLARIVLIDGDQLASIMLEKEIGVATDKVFKVYKIDENLFEV